MFRRSRSTLFEPYGRRKRRMPGWLLWLLAGLLCGAAGVLVVQQRYLPPRLSAQESAALRDAFEQAHAERLQLRAELAQTQQRLQEMVAQKFALEEAITENRTTVERLRADLATVVQALPPDPRGGSVEVRAGQFSAKDGVLDYQVVLLRDGTAARKPLDGTMRFTVAGESAGGTSTTVALQPIALSLSSHKVLRGRLPLPEGFRPRQATVQVLDSAAGRPLGMRVLLVR